MAVHKGVGFWAIVKDQLSACPLMGMQEEQLGLQREIRLGPCPRGVYIMLRWVAQLRSIKAHYPNEISRAPTATFPAESQLMAGTVTCSVLPPVEHFPCSKLVINIH